MRGDGGGGSREHQPTNTSPPRGIWHLGLEVTEPGAKSSTQRRGFCSLQGACGEPRQGTESQVHARHRDVPAACGGSLGRREKTGR